MQQNTTSAITQTFKEKSWVRVQAHVSSVWIIKHSVPTGIKFLERKAMEINPERAIRYIQENAPLFAQAKANRVFIENYLRTVKSRLMNEEAGTLGNKEAYAYAHADYVAQLEALKIATEEEERLKYMLSAAQARIEVWKTQEYSKRAELRNL